jgi:hypothetical protein
MPGTSCLINNHYPDNNSLVLTACSTELAVTKPLNTLVLDASKGSLCEVIISSSVKEIIVKGDKNSFVSVVFQPGLNMGKTALSVNTCFDGTCSLTENTQTAYVGKKFDIGCIKVGRIHTFSILGIQKGVTFGTIINQARYFTLNQTQDLFDYGLTQGGISTANWNRQQLRNLTSDTLVVGTFVNYGHFLVKTNNVGGVYYKPCYSEESCSTESKSACQNVTGNCEDINGKESCDRSLCDNRTFWLVNVLVKCKLHSTGRNKNFRVPIGILYLWAGADVRLCNVSCECIKGPEPCKCFDSVCYESDATKAPVINCVAVICGINEINPDKAPCSPNVSHLQENVWNKCLPGSESSCNSDCSDDCSQNSECSVGCGTGAIVNYSRIFGKEFKELGVNPCFLKNVNLTIRNSDLLICELVKRVWSCPLGCQAIDNASCNSHDSQPFVSTTYDQSYVKTVSLDRHGNQKAINSARIYSYLMNLTIGTPAVYLGQNLSNESTLDLSDINVQRLVFSQGLNDGDNGWPRTNSKANFCYALLTSKCKDDPVIDPKTTFPRRCCDLYCQYQIPDRVRPYCGRQFAPTQLVEACKPQIECSDVLNTVCRPVSCELCEVLPSSEASGNSCSPNVIVQKQCCKLPLPSKNICVVKNKPEPIHEVNNECCVQEEGPCDDEWGNNQ